MSTRSLQGSHTHENLKHAFAGESQANRRYLYFAKTADIEGYPDIGGLFRDTAEAETGHAHGHLDFLKAVGDPATGEPIGSTDQNLKAAVAGETYEYTDMYPSFRKAAEAERDACAVAEIDRQIVESREHADLFAATLAKAAKRFAALARVEEKHANHYREQLAIVSA